jgi:hypothetical protein
MIILLDKNQNAQSPNINNKNNNSLNFFFNKLSLPGIILILKKTLNI